jgi:hypothetical protein
MATRRRPGVSNTKPVRTDRVTPTPAQEATRPAANNYKKATKTLGNQARNETNRRVAATRANPTIPIQEQAARSNATRRSQARQSRTANRVTIGPEDRSPSQVPNRDRLGNAVALNEKKTFNNSPMGRANAADRANSAARREAGPGATAQRAARDARWNLNSNANSQRMPRRATPAAAPAKPSGGRGLGGPGVAVLAAAATAVYENMVSSGRQAQSDEDKRRRGRKRGYGATGQGPGVRR